MRALTASVVGYIVAALFNSLLVVVKETNAGVESWLKTTFGHHWIGHGVLVILVFILATLAASFAYTGRFELTDRSIRRMVIAIISSTIASIAIIAGFYAAHL